MVFQMRPNASGTQLLMRGERAQNVALVRCTVQTNRLHQLVVAATHARLAQVTLRHAARRATTASLTIGSVSDQRVTVEMLATQSRFSMLYIQEKMLTWPAMRQLLPSPAVRRLW
jgi:hypothetical protein